MTPCAGTPSVRREAVYSLTVKKKPVRSEASDTLHDTARFGHGYYEGGLNTQLLQLPEDSRVSLTRWGPSVSYPYLGVNQGLEQLAENLPYVEEYRRARTSSARASTAIRFF